MGISIDPKVMEHVAAEMVKAGLINADQLAVARVRQEDLGQDLSEILVKKGFVSEQQILGFLGKHLSIPYVSLKKYSLDADLAKELPLALAKRHHVVALRKDGATVVLAMADPLDRMAVEDIRQAIHAEVHPVLASAAEIEEAIERVYGDRKNSVELSLESIKSISSEVLPEEEKRLEEIATGAKIVQTVNEMIARAFQEGASDIHIEPRQNEVHVRFRIDGVLEEEDPLRRDMHLPVTSRIKIIGGMDIAERRVPQDGRVRVRIHDKPIDLRISTYPTLYGEKVVMRFLTMATPIGIDRLGFSEKDRKLFLDLIGAPHGIFLVTGPTGSGKSTTLYAALERLNTPEKNIVSVEDPVEREIPGISQSQVSAKAGVTFASALRAILRQDPDIIMLGEIRDRETAEIAVRAAITGHMVLSTLHTNTTVGTISRLIDLGVEPFLLSSALVGVLAQRLVRKICPECRQETPPPETAALNSAIAGLKKFYRGRGCSRCRLSGYSGRIGIFELAPITSQIRQLIDGRAPDAKIEEGLRRAGVRPILEDGLHKVESGITTIDEVLKVIQEE